MKRQPRGIPEGGEFAANVHDEAPASLFAFPASGSEERFQTVFEDEGIRPKAGTYHVSIPADIAGIDVRLDSETEAQAAIADRELSRFDSELGHHLETFSPLLLRSEASASSEIEGLSASARNIIAAEYGAKVGENAQQIASNTRTMTAAIELANDVSEDSIRRMHGVLMEGIERHTPGKYRQEPVWIGETRVGSPHVAPDHENVPEHMSDLISFIERPFRLPLMHIAIAHAQFETIHPFTDGNGRTGRALVQSLLRRYGVTRNVAVPVSAGLLANTPAYISALNEYRQGNPAPIVRSFADASVRAVANSRKLVSDIDSVRSRWEESVSARKDSRTRALLDVLTRRPILDAKSAAAEVGGTETNIYTALRSLESQGVLQTSKNREQTLWRAQEVLDTIDAFAKRAGRRVIV